ncbi:MAG TPA: recombinase family protein [Bryobacteraceae bacterium]|nr:recombinase family protein [Bryobacteraceae bacterium]
MTMKRAAIYARVSTGKQAAGELSLPDQVNQCEVFARSKGFEIAEQFVDRGVSARSDKRAEFQRMINLALARHRPFDVILVHSQSRLFRNTRDLLVYQGRLAEAGVLLVSITQDLGEGETADVLRTMVGALDEYQSRETAKHVARSMIENAKQGFWNGASTPFGYRTYAAETRGARVKKKVEINPVEAETVRLIFRLYVQGDGNSGPLGVKRIVSKLNAEGYRNRRGEPFRVQFLDKILRNTAYIGEHWFNRTDSRRGIERPKGDWVAFALPRILDDATFFAAQDKLDRQHPLKTPPRIVSSDVLLTAIAKCGDCGAPMRKLTGKSGQYQYYRCSRKADSGATACKGSAIPMGELDGIVLDALEEKILAPKRLRKLTEALVSRAGERAGDLSARRKELDGLRQKAKAEVTELYRLVGSGELVMDATLSAHIKAVQDKVQTLTRQVAHLDAERSAPVEALTDETVRRFGRAVSAALRNPVNRGFAKAYVQALVSEISVSAREIRISGPKAALAHSAVVFAKKGELVPAFAQEWRTQEDSNL